MGNTSPIMVFIEWQRDHIAEVSLELICEANRIAREIGASVCGVALGYGIETTLNALGPYGCQRVYYIEDHRLSSFSTVPYAKTLVNIIRKIEPKFVLFGATKIGRDLAPRVASALRCGLTADCTELQIGQQEIKGEFYKDLLLQIRPAFGGNLLATIISPDHPPSMATVRPGVMKRSLPDPLKTTDIIREASGLSDKDVMTEILDVVKKEKSVDLKSAKVIVAAGMGACNPESMVLIEKLADLLGGVIGASRPVVDSGMLSKDHQVGQTGTSVSPDLYIACGISGQIQHRIGIAGCKRILAINEDPNAPIFNVAHYGIVGDLKDVIPKLITAFKTIKGIQEDSGV